MSERANSYLSVCILKEFKSSIQGYPNPEYSIFKTEKEAESYIARFKRGMNKAD